MKDSKLQVHNSEKYTMLLHNFSDLGYSVVPVINIFYIVMGS